jgi:SAM-dependent methyltransferase
MKAVSALVTNQYSAQWFQHFHAGIPAERTLRETEFLVSQLPLPGFSRVADTCCGMGRHARSLSERGYSVTGIDRDAAALERARELAGGPLYEQIDVREWTPAPAAFDAVIVMSQSFGYFDAATNFSVLQRLARALRPGGRLVLDLWSPDFFAAHQGERQFMLPQGPVKETKQICDGRLNVRLDYAGGACDLFSWQLFTPDELSVFAFPAGLAPLRFCAGFQSGLPSATIPGWQCVLEKQGHP